MPDDDDATVERYQRISTGGGVAAAVVSGEYLLKFR